MSESNLCENKGPALVKTDGPSVMVENTFDRKCLRIKSFDRISFIMIEKHPPNTTPTVYKVQTRKGPCIASSREPKIIW